MADKRLVDFPTKTNPGGSDIVYFGSASDGFREVKTTLDQANSYKARLEISGSVNVDATFFGKNIINNGPGPVALTIPFNAGFPVTSEFDMIRNDTGIFVLQAEAGVTINGVSGIFIALSDQYDRLVATNIQNNEWTVTQYSEAVGTLEFQDVYNNTASGGFTLDANKPFNITSDASTNDIEFIASENTSGTPTLTLLTELSDATPGAEFSSWAINILKDGSQVSSILYGNSDEKFIFTGNGFRFFSDMSANGSEVNSLEFVGRDSGASLNQYGRINTSIQDNSPASSAKMTLSVSENDTGFLTTPYIMIDGEEGDIKHLKPLNPFSMTDAEFKAIPSPQNGLRAWSTTTNRDIVNRGTSGTPVYDESAYISDIPVVVVSAFGEMHFSGNTTETVISAINTPVKVNATYVSGDLQNFTHATGTLTSTDPESKQSLVIVSLTATMDLAVADITVSIAQNGTVIAKSEQTPFLGGITPASASISVQCLTLINTSDAIEVFVENNTSDDNIIVTSLNAIVPPSGGAVPSETVDLQDAYDNSPGHGIITLDASGLKDFILRRGDIALNAMKVKNDLVEILSKVTMFAGESTAPFELTNFNYSVPSESIKMIVNDTRPSAGTPSGNAFDFQVMGRNSVSSSYDIFLLNIFKTSTTVGDERSIIKLETFNKGVTKELIKFDGDTDTTHIGDVIVPKSLTAAEISSRTKIDTEIKYNSTDDRLQYTDLTSTERQIANLDDIQNVPDVSSGNPVLTFGTPIGIVGGSAGIAVSRKFYQKIDSVVHIKAVLNFTVNASAITIQINLPYSPGFTTTNQATGNATMEINDSTTPNDGSKLISTTSQIVLNDTLRLNLLAVNTSGSYKLDVDFMYRIQ